VILDAGTSIRPPNIVVNFARRASTAAGIAEAHQMAGRARLNLRGVFM
jgi:hypothetical protein